MRINPRREDRISPSYLLVPAFIIADRELITGHKVFPDLKPYQVFPLTSPIRFAYLARCEILSGETRSRGNGNRRRGSKDERKSVGCQ